jgi:hypothetical protein
MFDVFHCTFVDLTVVGVPHLDSWCCFLQFVEFGCVDLVATSETVFFDSLLHVTHGGGARWRTNSQALSIPNIS